jgi:acetyl esterase/lipase
LRHHVVAGHQSAEPLPACTARQGKRQSAGLAGVHHCASGFLLGNPTLALERGEKVLTPPAVWFQGRGDTLHDYKDVESDFLGNEPQRFCARYREAGGEITLHYLDMERHAGHSPDLSKTGDMFARMVEFVERHVKA